MNIFGNILDYIRFRTGHFSEFVFALPIALFVTLIYWIIRRIVHRKKLGAKFREVRRKARLNEIIRLSLVFWLAVLGNLTLTTITLGEYLLRLLAYGKNISPIYFSTGLMNLIPQIDDFAHILLNTALFVPIGLAVPFIMKKPRLWKTALAGFSMSLFIEVFQMFIGRESDITDVIANTLGMIFGHLVYLLIKKIFPKFAKKCSTSVNDFGKKLL